MVITMNEDNNFNIEHIGIYTANPERLRDWYCQTLGFAVVRKLEKAGRPPIFFLRASEGAQIELLPTTKTASCKRELMDAGYSHIGIVVRDINAVRQVLENKGVEVWGVRTTSNGWTIGYCYDPDGNTIEFIER